MTPAPNLLPGLLHPILPPWMAAGLLVLPAAVISVPHRLGRGLCSRIICC